jgi:hypothetical protein
MLVPSLRSDAESGIPMVFIMSVLQSAGSLISPERLSLYDQEPVFLVGEFEMQSVSLRRDLQAA